MDSIRVTAKTVSEAIMEAAIQLGTSSDNIEYTVVDEGSKGFFGIGGRKAVIEAKKKFTDEDLMKEVFGDLQEKPKREGRKEQPAREPRKEAKREQPAKDPKKEMKKDQPVKKEFRKEQPAKEAPEAAPEEKREAAASDSAREPKREPRREGRREGRRENHRPAGEERRPQRPAPGMEAEPKEKRPEEGPERVGKPETEAVLHVEELQADKEVMKAGQTQNVESSEETSHEPRTPRVPADPEEAKRRAVTFLEEMFRVMDMKVEIRAEFEDDTLLVDLTGDEMGILIGKRGQTLDSLQYLTSLVVNKGKASYVRVKLDTEDYRSRRKATLENLAKNIAFKVKKTRRPVFLEPMNPYERRIIHSALQNDPYVTTHSEGEEPNRKVVVTPRRKNERPVGEFRRAEYRKEQ